MSEDYRRAFHLFLGHTDQKATARQWLDGMVGRCAPRVGLARETLGGIPTFIPTTGRMTPHSDGRLRNIVHGQGTSTDGGEHTFGDYDLFEGTEQIQQLVISRAISGLHIR